MSAASPEYEVIWLVRRLFRAMARAADALGLLLERKSVGKVVLSMRDV